MCPARVWLPFRAWNRELTSGQLAVAVREDSLDQCRILIDCEFGFDERIRGSHHVYRKQGIPEKVNLQRDDGNAKPYQVKQLRRLALKYHLGDDE